MTMPYRTSVPPSQTTYHSFHDIELYEPASPPRKTAPAMQEFEVDRSTSSEEDRSPAKFQMKRQDSGYESYGPGTSPRTSVSYGRPSPPPRRPTSTSVRTSTSIVPHPRTRPTTRRSTNKSYHQPNSSSVHIVRPREPAPQPSSYFHFPPPDPFADALVEHEVSPPSPTSPPPQTTHYWTSDQTRRLEYAAIDAASRGVKGWCRRNLIPDCLTAKAERHLSFDDDTGSVRRYRLELEEEDAKSVAPKKRRTWHFWA
ncbi:uncharacterized protein F5Z01DRAFT_491724 [Emericellopsis atlantica]|uniref:Uncharacterized protein n=1 Tax=Emericellopsis atlantica TaxID=2614577 RepID=A0A9P8CRL7_9HYPO|nr:uncharacterized protein F5Z01DRAFT_491724 [Emericellopsis atlantica]KAG9256888.1 hypothetical protein F5Z01DRAFT_491724 [Emericellopsis atlantica]